jgi:hypothetical protein
LSAPDPIEEAKLFLKGRQVLRVIVIVGFYGALAMGLARWLAATQPLVQSRAYFAAMVILGLAAIAGGYLLRIGRCPRCRGFYALRADGKLRNNFTSRCLNCGLRIDGADLA